MFDRFEVDFSADVKQSHAEQSNFAQCYDISAGGLGLLTEGKLTPEANMEIWLGIPDGHPPFRSLARVLWSKQVQENKWRSGLEFEKVDFMGVRRIFDTPGHKLP